MKSYVALLRGIGPGNPNMRNDKLRGVFEDLGFSNVRTVISSGNVLFESDSSAIRAMETQVEEALPKQLGFTSTTIIRNRAQIQALVNRDPFAGVEHSDKSHLDVTFLKRKPKTILSFPYRPKDRSYSVLGLYDRDICSIVDLTSGRTSDLMQWLEKQFGKEITTRTYRTVGRILKKLRE
ncbi:MAG TPA: DUF1697 domain-containing protein [Actinomycetota bacterium]|jgi:uncharacterized protein (DUF1697 family)|nr:DUF1697 domain-containing protein [Actinomycetota bacterium]